MKQGHWRVEQHELVPVMWTAYVDYLRVTYDECEDTDTAYAAYVRAVREAGSAGLLGDEGERGWAWMGYYGVALGSAACGRGPSGAICQASSATAAGLFDQRVPWHRVPRIDLQVTVWFDRDEPTLAHTVARGALAARGNGKGRPRSVRLVEGFGEGDTCYIGKRGKRTRYFRVYDKGRESGGDEDWANSWRWEIELTDSYAVEAAATLWEIGQSDEAVLSMVLGHAVEMGVTMPLLSTMPPLPPGKRPKDSSTTLRRLLWLEGQVAPAIEKLRLAGIPSRDIMGILGLHAAPEGRTRAHALSDGAEG